MSFQPTYFSGIPKSLGFLRNGNFLLVCRGALRFRHRPLLFKSFYEEALSGRICKEEKRHRSREKKTETTQEAEAENPVWKVMKFPIVRTS
jgi:hypothetical protein